MTRPSRPRRASPLGAEIGLRHMSPEEALLLAEALNRLAIAVWDAFGDDAVRPDWDAPWPLCQSCPIASAGARR